MCNRVSNSVILSAALVIISFCNAAQAQNKPPVVEDAAPSLSFYSGKPFYADIQKFQAADSIQKPSLKSILFIGSSSFTYWQEVADYFPGHKIINRAFGGSSLTDLIRYQDFIIYPYQPKQIVVYCGENDLSSSDTLKVETVVNRFKQLYWDIRVRLPKVPISYVSMKPSPSRRGLMPKFKEANSQIKAFIATQKNATFIDIYPAMLQSDGQPIGEIFTADSLHMNAKGYAIWQKIMKPHLKK